MRARFDENKDVKDLRLAKKLLEDGERELFENQHVQPVKCKLFTLEAYLDILCPCVVDTSS